MWDFSWIADPSAWAGLGTLIVLEVVLGIDNLVFISILTSRLHTQEQRRRAFLTGLGLALVMRLVLLSAIAWIVSLTEPLVTIFGKAFSWRDFILMGGGIFLLLKGTMELHERLEGGMAEYSSAPTRSGFWQVIIQILVLDAVFSLDSIITSVGMVDHIPVLMLAIMVAAEDAKVHSQLANTSKMRIILDKFPVFVLGFLAVVLLNTFGFMSKEEAKMAGNFMNWCFLLGFSSIGLTTHLSDIKAAGLSGALIGFCVASVKAGLALLVVLCFLQ
mgnify:CR=1 FL=1